MPKRNQDIIHYQQTSIKFVIAQLKFNLVKNLFTTFIKLFIIKGGIIKTTQTCSKSLKILVVLMKQN